MLTIQYRQKIFAMLLGFVMIFSSGCSLQKKVSDEEMVLISYPMSGLSLSMLQNMEKSFNEEDHGFKVRLIISTGDWQTKLLTQFAAGMAPDVFFVPSTNVADFAARGLIANVQPTK